MMLKSAMPVDRCKPMSLHNELNFQSSRHCFSESIVRQARCMTKSSVSIGLSTEEHQAQYKGIFVI